MKDARPKAMTPLHDVGLSPRLGLAGAAAVAACALVTACGSVAAPGSTGPSSNPANSTAPASNAAGLNSLSSTPASSTSAGIASTAKVSLDVTIADTPTSPAVHYTLFCEPAGGTTPDPAAACSKLLTGENILAPRPLHVMCADVLGGGRATIAGTYLGKTVHVTIVNGGCDLARWIKLKSIFG